jgi:hypothetical protein
MRVKNKMKDFEVESEEWWGVAKEYFTKELENNLAHHKANERIQGTSWKLIKRIFQILFVVV